MKKHIYETIYYTVMAGVGVWGMFMPNPGAFELIFSAVTLFCSGGLFGMMIARILLKEY